MRTCDKQLQILTEEIEQQGAKYAALIILELRRQLKQKQLAVARTAYEHAIAIWDECGGQSSFRRRLTHASKSSMLSKIKEKENDL